jgi:hypothetical protein
MRILRFAVNDVVHLDLTARTGVVLHTALSSRCVPSELTSQKVKNLEESNCYLKFKSQVLKFKSPFKSRHDFKCGDVLD